MNNIPPKNVGICRRHLRALPWCCRLVYMSLLIYKNNLMCLVLVGPLTGVWLTMYFYRPILQTFYTVLLSLLVLNVVPKYLNPLLFLYVKLFILVLRFSSMLQLLKSLDYVHIFAAFLVGISKELGTSLKQCAFGVHIDFSDYVFHYQEKQCGVKSLLLCLFWIHEKLSVSLQRF